MTLESDAKFEEQFENLKNLLFNWLLRPKFIMFELKKYRGVVFDGTED